MNAILFQIMPWLAGLIAVLVAFVGVHFRAKATGKIEAREEVAAKTHEQAAVAAKEVRNVDVEIDRLPNGGAADRLKRDWLRK